MEDWVSGLNQRFTKPPAGKTAREFESHILRRWTKWIKEDVSQDFEKIRCEDSKPLPALLEKERQRVLNM